MRTKPNVQESAVQRHRVLLVDDHPLMREGVAQWIHRAEDLELCGAVESAGEAVSQAEQLKPDLVVTDISLPGRSGLDLIKELKAANPELPVLVLSMHEESLYGERCLRAGARGYVMKRAGGDRVLEAIHEVLSGRIAVSPALTARFLEAFSTRRPSAQRALLSRLTDREREVLRLMGEAKSNREIASELGLTLKTVSSHRINLQRKLGIKGAGELLRFALQQFREDHTED